MDKYTIIMEGFVHIVAQLHILVKEAHVQHNDVPRYVYPVSDDNLNKFLTIADKMYDAAYNADTGNVEVDAYIKRFICYCNQNYDANDDKDLKDVKDLKYSWYGYITGHASEWKYENIYKGIHITKNLITDMVIKVSKDSRFNKSTNDRDAEIAELKHRVEILEKAVNPMPDYDYKEYASRIAPFKHELVIAGRMMSRIHLGRSRLPVATIVAE